MNHKVKIFKKIEGISDIESVLLLVNDFEECRILDGVRRIIKADHRIVHLDEDIEKMLAEKQPDILFFRASQHHGIKELIEISGKVRGAGYDGIFLLIAAPIDRHALTSVISADGFDSHIFLNDSEERLRDAITWAILGRKRKVKYNICFDDSLDSFYTIDEKGIVYDINEAAVRKTRYTPRDVVQKKIRINEVGTLNIFSKMIKPLIKVGNIDRVFQHTHEEKSSVYQVKVKIQNAPTIGLVATVVKTDITKIIYTNTLDLLVNSITLLSQRDNYTAGHSARVFYYSLYYNYASGQTNSKRFSRALYLAALLHDIGKIGIRDNILLKKGHLTLSENNLISQHPMKGYRMLNRYEFLQDSLDFIVSHHEREDGRGYPNKLKGSKIPLGASIISIIDGFDAMTTNRPYRKALPFEVAVGEIRKNVGSQYRPEVGDQFLKMISPSLVSDVHELAKKPLETIANELIQTILRE